MAPLYTRWSVVSMVIFSIAGTLTVTSASDYPNFSIFSKGKDETAFKKCLKDSLRCDSKPECNGETPKPDELRSCAKKIFDTSKDCKVSKAVTLMTDYYQGYNDVKVLFCKNETFKEELTDFMDDDSCWKAFIVCLAPLEILQKNSQTQDPEYCKTMRKFLETECMDDKQTTCFENYTAFRAKYYDQILCQGEGNSAAASLSLHMATFVLLPIVFFAFHRH